MARSLVRPKDKTAVSWALNILANGNPANVLIYRSRGWTRHQFFAEVGIRVIRRSPPGEDARAVRRPLRKFTGDSRDEKADRFEQEVRDLLVTLSKEG